MTVDLFNLAEGLWWIGLGALVLFFYRQQPKHSTLLLIILILFGVSDFIEMSTGAWWRPWWLLVWKVLCIGIGLVLTILIYKNRKP